ncbi:hypothetical protein HOG21_02785 [bacterium]|jgi:hypothetical protein|nr:hypothetical protein [bacterium]
MLVESKLDLGEQIEALKKENLQLRRERNDALMCGNEYSREFYTMAAQIALFSEIIDQTVSITNEYERIDTSFKPITTIEEVKEILKILSE